MRIYYIIMSLVMVISVICTIAINPTGEGFVRGLNVLFSFLLLTAAIWAMTLVIIVSITVKYFKTKFDKAAVLKDKLALAMAAAGVLTPVINMIIIRIKSAIEYSRF